MYVIILMESIKKKTIKFYKFSDKMKKKMQVAEFLLKIGANRIQYNIE